MAKRALLLAFICTSSSLSPPSAGSSTHLTIVIDSLDSLLEQYDYSSTRSYDQVHELIRSILKGLNPHSRLIILHPLDSRNTEAKTLFSSLLSPLIFSSSKPSNNSSMEDSAKPSTGSGQTSILRLHSPALPRILLKEYGLLPPTTSEKLLESIRNEREARSREEAKKLEAGNRIQRGAGDHDKKKSSNRIKSSESSSDADPRFWEVLNNVASRGELLFSTSNSKTGDFEIEEAFSHQATSTSNSRSSSSSLIDSSSALSSITLDRLKPASRVDGDSSSHSKWAMIETRNRSRNGKWAEEVLGLVRSQDENQGGTLSVVGLDMRQTETKRGKLPWEEEEVEGSSKNVNSQQISTKTAEKSNTKPTSSQQEQDPHAKLVGNLPFNLSETSSQRAKRDDVPLPYTFYKQQENQSSNEPIQKGKILFEPESEDDEDEEDPDDDLDI